MPHARVPAQLRVGPFQFCIGGNEVSRGAINLGDVLLDASDACGLTSM